MRVGAVALLGFTTAACGGDAPPRSPYDPPPGAPYAAEHLTFTTDGGATLAGTLTLPPGGGPHPAVVTVTGSGLQDRDEHIRGVGAGYRPFREIADTLARRGVATLRFDDPGVGGSDPYPPGATPFDYADMVGAAVAHLRTRPDVDPDRIGLVGHSEGGVVAPVVAASDERITALVLLAGPAYTLERVNRFQRRQAMLRNMSTATPEEIEAEVARTDRPAELEARGNPWRWAAWGYDPLPTARAIAAPVLILQGEEDRRISPDQADTLAAAFRAGGNEDVTVRTFPRTDHFFLTRPAGEEPSGASDGISREVLGTLADWLVERL